MHRSVGAQEMECVCRVRVNGQAREFNRRKVRGCPPATGSGSGGLTLPCVDVRCCVASLILMVANSLHATLMLARDLLWDQLTCVFV